MAKGEVLEVLADDLARKRYFELGEAVEPEDVEDG